MVGAMDPGDGAGIEGTGVLKTLSYAAIVRKVS
jgi:hypothetical protein